VLTWRSLVTQLALFGDPPAKHTVTRPARRYGPPPVERVLLDLAPYLPADAEAAVALYRTRPDLRRRGARCAGGGVMRRCDRERVPWPRRYYEGDGDPIAFRAWAEHVNTSAGQSPPWRRRVIRTPGLLDHLRERVALPGSGR